MEDKKLYYKGTDIDARLGDKLLYKAWWIFDKPATVVYIPGQSKSDWLGIGDTQWAIKIDNEENGYLAWAYFPKIGEVMPKKITFISRGKLDDEIKGLDIS